jgi:acyl-homoserine lactone acylase PvdQ
MRRRVKATFVVTALAAACALAPQASAQVQPYGTNDYGGFRNILPPGQGQTVNGAALAAFQANGTRPPNWIDQSDMYEDLVFATPGLASSEIDQYFKDGTFGTQNPVRTYSPRSGVTVVRDTFNVPHVYGATRSDVMFGAGYIGAEDRLFFMDVLRHAGRATLSGFIGDAGKDFDAAQWDVAPYKEEDLQRQIDLADEVYGAEGDQLRQDLTDYVAGINQYIVEAYADPNKMPGEYAAIQRPLIPWKGTDVIATASLIGGIFGKGGGGEVGNAEVYNAAKQRFGDGPGKAIWADMRRANDAEAPTTVQGQSFPYQNRPATEPENNPAVALPKPGAPLVDGSPDDAPPSAGGLLAGLLQLGGGSNALLVSGQESASGHPLAVMGPQVAYWSPEILFEQDLHGPDIDARGATFVGVNLYVLLGRGQDFAWSATSAGQDIIDTFAEELCEPGGGTPTIDSMHYLYDPPGPDPEECRPIEVLERVNFLIPGVGHQGPPETYRLEAQRTVHGIISKRGIVERGGVDVPVAFAKLRSTYYHEADSARAFSDLNRPSKVQSASDFQQVMSKINFTFNWFYADDRDIAYFNSGDNPVRAAGTDPEFPTWGGGAYDWQGWDPVLPENGTGIDGGTNIADYTPFSEHPQVINQEYITSWNNKQAPGYRAAEDNYAYGPNHRSQSLDERIEPEILGGQTMNLAELIDAMEDAGTVDLRGSQALPWMLDVLRSGSGVPADLADEVTLLQNWINSGAHRRDRDQSGTYDHSDAVRLMDAWWDAPGATEGVLEQVFKPVLGPDLFAKVRAQLPFDDPPGPVGSAYISGWYGYLEKDLRSLLGAPVSDAYSRSYCGGDQTTPGTLATCHDLLVDSLRAVSAVSSNDLYGTSGCSIGDAQMCHDGVEFTTVGAVTAPEIHWINRPTWQQAVEIQGHRGRGQPIGNPPAGSGSPTAGTPATGSAKGKAKKCKRRGKRKNRAASAKKRKRCKKKKRRR